VAVPTNNPLDVSGVTSGGENTSVPSSLSGSIFTLSDLEGTWYFHQLTSADGSPKWAYGTAIVDNNGNVTSMSYTVGGDPDLGAISVILSTMTSSGVVTSATEDGELVHSVMSQDKSLIVGIKDDNDPVNHKDYDIIILQK
jgi:hypothetical protein